MRDLNMLDKHRHLFLRNKSLEVLPRLVRIELVEDGPDAIPNKTTSRWEEIFHEDALAGDFHLNSAIAKTVRAAVETARPMTLCGTHRIIEGLKLDICIHGLAGHTIHDDVYRLEMIRKDPSGAT